MSNWLKLEGDVCAVTGALGGMGAEICREFARNGANVVLLDLDEEKVKACAVAKLAGADFVKTSTGFSTGGAKVEDIRLMRETVGPELGVKASGGIHSYEEAVAMLKAGASRLGASATLKIMEG